METMKYSFYGGDDPEVAKISPITDEYKGISSPMDLYRELCECWCAETSPPRMRDRWTADNKTLGQCSITAFLVQDIFGGEVYGIPRPGGFFHCFNIVDGVLFDLTDEQFGDEKLDYDNRFIQSRKVHFDNKEKLERYELLKERLKIKTGDVD